MYFRMERQSPVLVSTLILDGEDPIKATTESISIVNLLQKIRCRLTLEYMGRLLMPFEILVIFY